MTSRKRVWYFSEDDAPKGGWQQIPFEEDPTFDAVEKSMEPRPDPPVDLWRGISLLTEKQRLVIELRYGFSNRGSHGIDEIATIMGISHQAVSRLERRAMNSLRRSQGVANQVPYR